MNRFVLTYTFGSGMDWFDAVEPIEADSKEEIYVKLSEKAVEVWNEYQAHSDRRAVASKLFFSKSEKQKTPADVKAYQEACAGLRTDTEFVLFDRKFDALNLLVENPKFPKEREFDHHNVTIQTLDEWFAKKDV